MVNNPELILKPGKNCAEHMLASRHENLCLGVRIVTNLLTAILAVVAIGSFCYLLFGDHNPGG